MFGRFDKDGDGKISKEEAPAEMWERLSKADDNADGLISKEELQKAYENMPGGGGRPPRPEGDRPPGGAPDKGKGGDNAGKPKRPEVEA